MRNEKLDRHRICVKQILTSFNRKYRLANTEKCGKRMICLINCDIC